MRLDFHTMSGSGEGAILVVHCSTHLRHPTAPADFAQSWRTRPAYLPMMPTSQIILPVSKSLKLYHNTGFRPAYHPDILLPRRDRLHSVSSEVISSWHDTGQVAR